MSMDDAHPPIHSRSVRSPCGDRLVMDRAGSGDVTVLLLHGWTCRRAHWRAQLPDLSRDHAMVSLDLSGHGDSVPVARADWSVTGLAGDVLAAIRALGRGPVVLVGHSMGGAVALEAARAAEVRGVVLVDTFVLPYGDLSEEDARAIEGPFHDDFAAAIGHLVDQTAAASMDADIRTGLKRDMASADPAWALPLWRDLLRWTPAAAFEEVQAPIHAINGDLIPEPARRRCAPRVTEWRLPGAGHFPQMEMPAAFNALLRRVLAAL